MTDALRALAKFAGLDAEYTSWNGEPARSSDESVLAILRMLAPQLGIRVDRPDDAPAAIAALVAQRWKEYVPPVVVGWDGVIDVPFAVAAEVDRGWVIDVETESGKRHHVEGTLFALRADGHAWPGGVVHCLRHARIPVGEDGYHTIKWRIAGQDGTALAICAPRRAYGGPGEGKRRWGVFAPVYGLATPATGLAGDLSTLAELFAQVERRGGSYIATLPILAQFLDEPCAFSPYSPASRLWWNELYADLGAIGAEIAAAPGSAPVRPGSAGGLATYAPPVAIAGTLPDRRDLRPAISAAEGQRGWIDYRTQYASRRRALDELAPRLLAARGTEIDAWARATGAYDYAMFRAFGEQARAGWYAWPDAHKTGTPFAGTREAALAAGADAAHVNTHVASQWAMARQLDTLSGGRVQLYLDLPVGVNTDAYEVWRWPGLFLVGASAGAPPDALFLGGQDWGLPPVSPIASRREHHRYMIACIRHHVRAAGMLRIDHIMGLFRLYCVPAGRPATDGVYVRYPSEDLLAILALESSRAKCALVGEDLGTVPDNVRPAMAEHGLFRLHVGQWAFPAKPGLATAPSPAESVACLNTHDTPTFAGWWRGTDIDDKLGLGLVTAEHVAIEKAERSTARQAVAALSGTSLATDHLTEVERAMVTTTEELATGPAEIVLVTLDDLVLEPVPHNVPGTVTQHPNWQRRITSWRDVLDEARAPAAAAAAVTAVIKART